MDGNKYTNIVWMTFLRWTLLGILFLFQPIGKEKHILVKDFLLMETRILKLAVLGNSEITGPLNKTS